MSLQIKNWAKFQHFKDRRPPWVKLYRDLLDDREWHKLDGDAAKLLVSLWLIGSEDSGNLPPVDELAFRLRLDEKHVEKCLKRLEHWLISERYQDDISLSQKISATDIEVPLRDREEKRREETEDQSPAKLPTCPQDQIVSLYHKHLPELPSVRLMTDKRKKAIRKFWEFVLTSKRTDGERRATDEQTALDWIDAFFLRARDNDFLMGRIPRIGSHANWQADLEFLLSEKGISHVIEKTREAA